MLNHLLQEQLKQEQLKQEVDKQDLSNIKYDNNPEDSFDLKQSLIGKDSSPRDFIPYYVGSELRAYRYKDHKIHFITKGAYGMPPATPSLQHE